MLPPGYCYKGRFRPREKGTRRFASVARVGGAIRRFVTGR
jgi:hypothetical protein